MDDLLDLNWSSSSSKVSNVQHPVKKSSNGSAYSAFDSLASAGSSVSGSSNKANYYSSFSSTSNGTGIARPVSPAVVISPSNTGPRPRQEDAFSSLFSDAAAGSVASTSSAKQSSMTMQQRMALQQNDSVFSSAPINAGVPQKTSSDPWDFDMLAPAASTLKSTSPGPSATVASTSTALNSSPFDDLDAFTSNTSKMAVKDPYDDLLPPSQQDTTSSSSAKGFDDPDDVLGLLGKPVQPSSRQTPRNGTSSPAVHSPQPTRSRNGAASSGTSTSTASSRPPSRAVAARTPSPPPHVLGEVVSMGFSVPQARRALAATLDSDSKWNVQAAIEALASDGAANAQRTNGNASATGGGGQGPRDDEMEAYERKEARRAQTRARERPSGLKGESEPRRRPGDALSPHTHGHSQSQSREDDNASPDLLAQASSIGFSVLKSANSYWKTSKAQLSKAMEDNKFLSAAAEARGGSGRSSPHGGRPKWMTDSLDEDPVEAAVPPVSSAKGKQRKQSSFRDDSDDEQPAPPGNQFRRGPPPRQQPPEENLFQDDVLAPHPPDRSCRPQTQTAPQTQGSLKPPEAGPRIYASPNRRKAQPPQPPPSSTASSGPPSPKTAFVRSLAPSATSRPSRPPRQVVSASPGQVASSLKARTKGNEHFKLGQYGEAVTAYTSALSSLPDGHMGRVAVLNNRANARLKNGEERQACEDASEVLGILLGPTVKLEGAKKEDWTAVLQELEDGAAAGPGEDRVDGADALGKALSRRARGYEANEKWRQAMSDWDTLHQLGNARVTQSAGGMRVVSDGLARCRKVFDGPASSAGTATSSSTASARPAPPKPKPKPKPKAAPAPSTSASARPSAAVTALREGAVQAEADEVERFRVKDSVDAKIASWRGGKEANLRALIASLDAVLWDELGWKKVGMHELLTESQLKVRYVRAISKVHPDKIGNTASVENRMIAAAVFSTLSDAWNNTK